MWGFFLWPRVIHAVCSEGVFPVRFRARYMGDLLVKRELLGSVAGVICRRMGEMLQDKRSNLFLIGKLLVSILKVIE